MGNEIIGRENEIIILEKLLISKKPECKNAPVSIFIRIRLGAFYNGFTYSDMVQFIGVYL
jgi:hypothetical protein